MGIALAFSGTAGLAFLFMLGLVYPAVVQDGKIFFQDPDSYTWLDRAGRVLSGPGIYVLEDPGDNYPLGFSTHWTQPFHWVLALFSLVFSLFGCGESALEWAGVWIGPLFGFLTAGMLAAWVFRRWPWPMALLTVLVFMAHPFEQWTFALGRPDHQCLLIPCLLAAVLLLLDLDGTGKDRRRILLSALLTGAGIWISVQALGIFLLVLGVMALRCALAPEGERPRRLRDALTWSLASAGATLVFSLIERRGQALSIVTDSISIGHALLMAMPALGFLITDLLRRKRASLKRLPWFFTAVVPPGLLFLAAGLWLWQRQGTAHGSEALDAMSRWFSQNLEFMPALFFVDGHPGLGRFHEAFGYTFYALPLLLFGLVKTRLLSSSGKWILGAGIVLASLLTLWQWRWRDLHALLLAPLLVVGVTESLLTFFPSLREKIKKPGTLPPAPALLAFGAVIVLFIPWIQQARQGFLETRQPRQDYQALRILCEWIRANDPMDGTQEKPGEPAAVLAVWGEGPMVKYWSGRPVVAGPYHRNIEGILDTMRAYTARSQEAFDEVASKRRIRYLLRPPLANPDFDIYSYELIVGVEKPALYIRARQLLPDGKRTLRDYGLSPGMTDDKIIKILRLRLERNEWEGWDRLRPIEVPGLEILLPDARDAPYLYRYIYPDPE